MQQQNNKHNWIIVINPYQKKIEFVNQNRIFLTDFCKNDNELVYFGCILSEKLWRSSDFIGIFGELCIVNLDRSEIIQLGMYATINKYADSLVEVAKGVNNVVFWDETRIKYLRATLSRIKQLTKR